MDIHALTPNFAVSGQLSVEDVGRVAARGFKSIIINRPDGEAADQPTHAEMEAAARLHGLRVAYVPVVGGRLLAADIAEFEETRIALPVPQLAYCGSGRRSAFLWALSRRNCLADETILATVTNAGFDVGDLRAMLNPEADEAAIPAASSRSTIVIVGGGAAGLATAASLMHRRPDLKITVVEPSETHVYQPGWTLVGAGVFRAQQTLRAMAGVVPEDVTWLKASVAAFEPGQNQIVLSTGKRLSYDGLVVAPGLKIDLDAVPGLRNGLGRRGVTSNYMIDYAPYTWQLVSNLDGGDALFTQPKGPFKCAGAPQKAMYLSCDAWRRRGSLGAFDVSFHTPGTAIFGVKDFVPALEACVERYGIDLYFREHLIAVDADEQIATFEVETMNGATSTIERPFDMLHVCPPQAPMDFVKDSPLANADGWVDVDQYTLQHPRYSNVFSLGDACGAPNAKTAAAARKQAPVVAVNLLAALDGGPVRATYNGYGSCPLITQRGKALLAEFSYGGALDPSFPTWLANGRKPSRFAWWLKTKAMPHIYFDLMLKGREWLAKPDMISAAENGSGSSGQGLTSKAA